MLGALLLFGEGHLFGIGNIRPLLISHGLAGFFGSIFWFIPQSMIADVIDEDELVTGQRHEGAFFGIFSFGQQLATGLSLLVAGTLVDWFAGLVPGIAEQSGLTVNRIALLYSVLPATLVIGSVAFMLRYCWKGFRRQVIRWACRGALTGKVAVRDGTARLLWLFCVGVFLRHYLLVLARKR